MDLTLTVETQGANPVVAVNGEIDVQSAETLTAQLHDLIQPSAGQVVVDLTGTSFIDSAGLSAMIDAKNRADDCDVDLIFVCPTDHRAVRKMIEITGLSTFLTIRPTRTDAG